MSDYETWSLPLPKGIPEERTWPGYVAYALDAMLYSYPEDVEEMVRFEQRWGGLEPEHFRRALYGDVERDRLFALFVLGFISTPEARAELLSFLDSPRPLERWASAIGLGQMREKRALPILFAMLTDYLPPNVPLRPNGETEWYFESWRSIVPQLLGAWGEQVSVPALRHGLREAIRIEDTLFKPPTNVPRTQWNTYRVERDSWSKYQDQLVYAMGRLGAFGVLAGLSRSYDELGIWSVHLVVGHLHGQYPLEAVVHWKDIPNVRDEVMRLLERFFGLDLNEREQYMAQYERMKLPGVALSYLTQQKLNERGWPG